MEFAPEEAMRNFVDSVKSEGVEDNMVDEVVLILTTNRITASVRTCVVDVVHCCVVSVACAAGPPHQA